MSRPERAFYNDSFFSPKKKKSPDEKKQSSDDSKPKEIHEVNWYVYRNAHIRNSLDDLSTNQELFNKINILFRNLENDGPIRREFDNFTYDRRHDMYHCHAIKGEYVVLWEVDEKKHIINIVRMGTHENFSYERTHLKVN